MSEPLGESTAGGAASERWEGAGLPGRRWSDLASPDLSFLREPAGDRTVGLVPVGAIEQHGPHLPTGTDTIIACTVAEGAAARSSAIVLPPIPVGCSFGHGTLLPGTISLTPAQLADIARSYATWAGTSGLRRILFVNAHLGNAGALAVAVDHLRLERPDLRCASYDVWSTDPVLLKEMTADGSDVHANRAETSLMLAIAPHLVRLDRVATADDEDRTADLVFRYTAPSLSSNGVTGRPSEASPELGAALFELAVEALAELVRRGSVEEPPLGEPGRGSIRTP